MNRCFRRSMVSFEGWLALACLAGCSTASSSLGPDETPKPSLEEITQRIDPGSQPPLHQQLPPWMFDMLDLSPQAKEPASVLLASSASEQAAFQSAIEKSSDSVELISAIRSLARAAVFAEQADEQEPNRPETLAQLALVYASLDVPELVHDQGLFVQLAQLFVASNPADDARLEALVGIAQQMVAAAGPLHRRTVAQLARRFPEHPAVPDALLHIAQSRRGDDEPITLALSQAALSILGGNATAKQQLSVARTCFAALDLVCGDAALKTARSKNAKAEAEELQHAKEDAGLAHRIVELKGASTFELQLQRARAQFQLRRYAAAKAEFEALRKVAPQDARPVAGLAQHAIETRLDYLSAHRLIDEAGPLRQGDQLYYEIAIGTRAMVALSTIVPRLASASRDESIAMLRPFFSRMRKDIDGYVSLGSADARFLSLMLEVGEEMFTKFSTSGLASRPAVLETLTERAIKLQREIPNNEHAYRLLMSASLFEVKKSLAITAVTTEAPASPEHDALVARRVRAMCDLAAMWGDKKLAQEARAVIEAQSGSSDEIKLAWADSIFVEASLGVHDNWNAVAEAYQVILNGSIEGADPRVLNNIGVAMWHLGHAETATKLWAISGAAEVDYSDISRLNATVADPGAPTAAFEALTKDGHATETQLAAMAWLVARSKKTKGRSSAATALETAVETKRKNSSRPLPPDAYARIALQGSFQAGLGYSIDDGLEIALDSGASLWGILAPPRP